MTWAVFKWKWQKMLAGTWPIILFWLTLLLFYIQYSVPSQIRYSIYYKYITNNEILQILHTTFCMHVWTKAFLTLSGNFYRFSGFSQTPSVGSKWKLFLNLASSLGENPLFSIVTLRVGVGTGRDRGSNIFILGRFTIERRNEQRKKLYDRRGEGDFRSALFYMLRNLKRRVRTALGGVARPKL